jgi:hypothetical protein
MGQNEVAWPTFAWAVAGVSPLLTTEVRHSAWYLCPELYANNRTHTVRSSLGSGILPTGHLASLRTISCPDGPSARLPIIYSTSTSMYSKLQQQLVSHCVAVFQRSEPTEVKACYSKMKHRSLRHRSVAPVLVLPYS